MNIAMQKHSPYLVFFFILPSLILLLIAFSNLLSTFSYSNYQIGFYIISFISVIFSMSFIVSILDKMFLTDFRGEISIFSILSIIFSLYVMLDEDMIENLLIFLPNKNSMADYLLLYIALISHVINSVFIVLLCLSLIVYVPQALFSSIISFVSFMQVSFSFIRLVAVIFIVTLSFKSICLMLLQKGF